MSFRDVSGIILLDKARGISSNLALQKVRRLFKARKAGHAGTLDPLATGLLVIALGEANKYSRWALSDDKAYTFDIILGKKTDTADAEGNVICEKDVPFISNKLLEEAKKAFTGNILQTPPDYSALKVDGKRAYELAREGKKTNLEARDIFIKNISLERSAFSNNLIKAKARVSKGTYIRTLSESIAEFLGTVSYCDNLRRISSGKFDIHNTYTYDYLLEHNKLDFLDSLLIPIDTFCKEFKRIDISERQEEVLYYGKVISFDKPLRCGESIMLNEGDTLAFSNKDNYHSTYCNDKFIGITSVIKKGDHFYIKPVRMKAKK